jgi:signal transduction histidine kinase
MNRLWVRFSLTFGFFALLGPLLLTTIGFLSLQTGVLRLFIRNEITAEGGLTDQLVEHYRRYGSWANVTELMVRYDNFVPRGPDGVGFGLVLYDEGRRSVYGEAYLESRIDTPDGAEQILALSVDGRTRGYLSIVQVYNPLNLPTGTSGRIPIIGQFSNILMALGIFIAVPGVIAGVVASRALAAPLAQLAEAARRLGKRDFSVRAEVKGSIEIREVAHAFNEMAHDLDQAETLRRNLVADVAHELRTPLAVLQANLQALIDGVYPLESAEIVRLLAQTELLTRLVEELRLLSQAEAHQLPLHRTPVDLNLLAFDIATTFESTTKQQGIALDVQQTAEPLVVEGDAGRLRQVLNNLVQNAITHTPDGGSVLLTLKREGQHALISVTDTGMGIAAEHLPYVFDRFYRVDRSRSRETGGTGLGLAIAKAIIDLHGGTISAASDEGRGTTFTIRLPVEG